MKTIIGIILSLALSSSAYANSDLKIDGKTSAEWLDYGSSLLSRKPKPFPTERNYRNIYEVQFDIMLEAATDLTQEQIYAIHTQMAKELNSERHNKIEKLFTDYRLVKFDFQDYKSETDPYVLAIALSFHNLSMRGSKEQFRITHSFYDQLLNDLEDDEALPLVDALSQFAKVYEGYSARDMTSYIQGSLESRKLLEKYQRTADGRDIYPFLWLHFSFFKDPAILENYEGLSCQEKWTDRECIALTIISARTYAYFGEYEKALEKIQETSTRGITNYSMPLYSVYALAAAATNDRPTALEALRRYEIGYKVEGPSVSEGYADAARIIVRNPDMDAESKLMLVQAIIERILDHSNQEIYKIEETRKGQMSPIEDYVAFRPTSTAILAGLDYDLSDLTEIERDYFQILKRTMNDHSGTTPLPASLMQLIETPNSENSDFEVALHNIKADISTGDFAQANEKLNLLNDMNESFSVEQNIALAMAELSVLKYEDNPTSVFRRALDIFSENEEYDLSPIFPLMAHELSAAFYISGQPIKALATIKLHDPNIHPESPHFANIFNAAWLSALKGDMASTRSYARLAKNHVVSERDQIFLNLIDYIADPEPLTEQSANLFEELILKQNASINNPIPTQSLVYYLAFGNWTRVTNTTSDLEARWIDARNEHLNSIQLLRNTARRAKQSMNEAQMSGLLKQTKSQRNWLTAILAGGLLILLGSMAGIYSLLRRLKSAEAKISEVEARGAENGRNIDIYSDRLNEIRLISQQNCNSAVKHLSSLEKVSSDITVTNSLQLLKQLIGNWNTDILTSVFTANSLTNAITDDELQACFLEDIRTYWLNAMRSDYEENFVSFDLSVQNNTGVRFNSRASNPSIKLILAEVIEENSYADISAGLSYDNNMVSFEIIEHGKPTRNFAALADVDLNKPNIPNITSKTLMREIAAVKALYAIGGYIENKELSGRRNCITVYIPAEKWQVSLKAANE